MIILGLTGSIGMGKTTTAAMFKKHGIAVYSADESVHELYQQEHVIALIAKVFPDAVVDGEISRQKLSTHVLGNLDKMQKLEAIVHPLVRQKEQEFIKLHKRQHDKLVVLDIPLLFETHGENRVDKIIVVTAPFDIQKQRVLSRAGMNEEKFSAILKQQMSDNEKRARADFIIDTGKGLLETEQAVQDFIKNVTEPPLHA